MTWTKHAKLLFVMALPVMAANPRMADAQILPAGNCPAAPGVTTSMAQARYAWGLWCRAHPLNSLGGTPFPAEHYLTAASIQDYAANPGLQPYLYPAFFNQANFALVDLPGSPGIDCSLLATSAFNVGLCIAGAGCADGTPEQMFSGGMVGCAGAVTFANRNTLCAPGFRTVTAAEWVALRNGLGPSHNYWTNDALKYSGAGSSSCFVSTTVGTDCGATPMRVCTGGDPEGNVCNWTHCGINANIPDQFFGGCVGNTTAGTLCVPNTGCADGSVEQVFSKGMVGCAGSVAFVNRGTLCAPGYQPATAAQWVANRGTAVPTHDYWTNDALKWSGSGPSACFVSTSVGSDSCGTSPMRVCTPAGADAEGNTCNWTHCGLDANTPDQLFGGCVSNAGTLCMPTSVAMAVLQNTATVFSTRFLVTERHSVSGGSTAGSLAAAAMMGAQGFNGRAIPPDWETTISSSCTTRTGGTIWPGGCKPSGMASAMAAFTSNDWGAYTWSSVDRISALNELVASFQFYQSPVLVPIFGQSDHWVTITQVTATLSGSTWSVNQVRVFDGGSVGAIDSSGNSYVSGLQVFSGNVWANVFYQVLSQINPSCDPCTADPYYGKYVLISDPARGRPHPAVLSVFAKAPAAVAAGSHPMTEHLAQMSVWSALASAGLDTDPEIWHAIRHGVPGTALQVNAEWPSGSSWNYYLVPILSSTKQAIAFVQLATGDGSFEGIHVLAKPARFAPLTILEAERLARRALAKGERLTGGVLTWAPRGNVPIAKSPLRPYYEFGIDSAAKPGTHIGRVWVTLNEGAVLRDQRAKVPSSRP